MTTPNRSPTPTANLPKNWESQRRIQDRLLSLFASFGYGYIDVPVLQPTDLFLRKSGGELASQMFSFLDPAGQSVSLRPEFTAPIMVQHLQAPDARPLPARWCYAGPVFRYGGPDPDSSGQFSQIGAELIGSTSVLSDAELITLAAQVLQDLGVQDAIFQVAGLQVLQSLLNTLQISDRAKSFVAAQIPRLRSGSANPQALLDEAQYFHLSGQGPENHDLAPAIIGLDDDQARQVLRGFLHWRHGDSPELGQRHPDEVLDRLLRKLRGSDDQARLDHAFSLVGDLAQIQGSPVAACHEARRVLQSAGADTAPLDRLSELITSVQQQDALGDNIQVDFGLARGIAYYNGIIFQVNHPQSPNPLGGGGRYDPLALALGSPFPVPALGFAYNLDTLAAFAAAGSSKTASDSPPSQSILVAPQSPEANPAALQTAQRLREAGNKVHLEVSGLPPIDLPAYAASLGCQSVVTVNPDGSQTSIPAH